MGLAAVRGGHFSFIQFHSCGCDTISGIGQCIHIPYLVLDSWVV